MLAKEALGVTLGSTLAVAWSSAWAQTAAPVLTSRRPTLAEVAAAQGMITWSLFLAAALLGAATWAGRRATEGEDRSLVRAAIRSTGWGFATALIMIAFDFRAEIVGGSVYVAGILAELLTVGVIKIGGQIAANPLRAWRYYRAGRAAYFDDEEKSAAAEAQAKAPRRTPGVDLDDTGRMH